MAVPAEFEHVCIIDADTHLTEPHDLWTSRAPAKYRDRVPKVVEHKGQATWVVDDVILARAGASGVIAKDGTKVPGIDFFTWTIDDVHPGAHLVPERLAMMDEQGIWGQIVYPNTMGFGGQALAKVTDPELRLLTATIYNDAMADIQAESGGRLLPMAVLPWWDLDAAVAETVRARELGLHGINTTSAPHDHGYPDLGAAYWNPLWEACSDLGLPVNFHIGAASSDMDWYGRVSWPSLGPEQKMGVGSTMLYLNNAGVLANLIYSGVLERFPDLQVVSVESAVGWIPFMLQALDHQLGEMSPAVAAELSLMPSQYFARQIHACFWFERQGIDDVIDAIGHEHLMFETDFPHPTALQPGPASYASTPREHVEQHLSGLPDDLLRKLLQTNAARVYHLD